MNEPCYKDNGKLRVLAFSTSFPSSTHPTRGVFVAHRLAALARFAKVDYVVLAPTPLYPRMPSPGLWQCYANVPFREKVRGLPTLRPRYVHVPKLDGRVQPRAIASACEQLMARLCARFKPHLIDAHFAYPTGAAVRRLARSLGLPYVVTGRGEDMIEMLEDRVVRREVGSVLRQASALIAVSHQIAENMLRLGADKSKVHVIPNGVDLTQFPLLDRTQARRVLQLPRAKYVVLSVGNRIARKGHEIVIRAVGRLVADGYDIACCVVGGPVSWERDTLPVLRNAAQEQGIADRVILAGAEPPERLKWWYAAADVMCLASRREGCPNVVLEALACGRPVVATAVGETTHLIQPGRNGYLVDTRTPEAIAAALKRALHKSWHPKDVRDTVATRSWQAVAVMVRRVFDKTVNGGHGLPS